MICKGLPSVVKRQGDVTQWGLQIIRKEFIFIYIVYIYILHIVKIFFVIGVVQRAYNCLFIQVCICCQIQDVSC